MSTLIIGRWRFAWLAVAVLAVQGCSTQTRRVDCDGRLTPINAAAPRGVVSAVGPADASDSSEETNP